MKVVVSHIDIDVKSFTSSQDRIPAVFVQDRVSVRADLYDADGTIVHIDRPLTAAERIELSRVVEAIESRLHNRYNHTS